MSSGVGVHPDMILAYSEYEDEDCVAYYDDWDLHSHHDEESATVAQIPDDELWLANEYGTKIWFEDGFYLIPGCYVPPPPETVNKMYCAVVLPWLLEFGEYRVLQQIVSVSEEILNCIICLSIGKIEQLFEGRSTVLGLKDSAELRHKWVTQLKQFYDYRYMIMNLSSVKSYCIGRFIAEICRSVCRLGKVDRHSYMSAVPLDDLWNILLNFVVPVCDIVGVESVSPSKTEYDADCEISDYYFMGLSIDEFRVVNVVSEMERPMSRWLEGLLTECFSVSLAGYRESWKSPLENVILAARLASPDRAMTWRSRTLCHEEEYTEEFNEFLMNGVGPSEEYRRSVQSILDMLVPQLTLVCCDVAPSLYGSYVSGLYVDHMSDIDLSIDTVTIIRKFKQNVVEAITQIKSRLPPDLQLSDKVTQIVHLTEEGSTPFPVLLTLLIHHYFEYWFETNQDHHLHKYVMVSSQCREKARVPMSRFSFQTEELDLPPINIEISSSPSKDGVNNTRLLTAYARRYPEVRDLARCLKFFSFRRRINGTLMGWFSSFALTLLVVNFLLLRRIIQPIPYEEIDTEAPPPPHSATTQKPSLPALIVDFCRFYVLEWLPHRCYVSVRTFPYAFERRLSTQKSNKPLFMEPVPKKRKKKGKKKSSAAASDSATTAPPESPEKESTGGVETPAVCSKLNFEPIDSDDEQLSLFRSIYRNQDHTVWSARHADFPPDINEDKLYQFDRLVMEDPLEVSRVHMLRPSTRSYEPPCELDFMFELLRMYWLMTSPEFLYKWEAHVCHPIDDDTDEFCVGIVSRGGDPNLIHAIGKTSLRDRKGIRNRLFKLLSVYTVSQD